MWFVHANSKVKEEAMLWLEFFSEQENYQDFINKVGWIPTQPNIKVNDQTLNEASKIPMQLSFEQIHCSREGEGELAAAQIHFLAPMGTYKDPKEFAERAKADWDAAAK